MYEFKEQEAYDFARHMMISTKLRGSELVFVRCPYCNGGKNSKDKGTFSINIKNGMYKCMRASCGQQGFFLRLAKDFDFKIDNEFVRYSDRNGQYRKLKQPKQKIIPKENAIVYLQKRGIPKEIVAKYQVTTQKDNDNVICFPVFTEEGTLINVKYRNVNFRKENGGAKEWFEKSCKPYLFGTQLFDGKFDRFILTEGEIDAMSVAAAGIDNCFSVIGGKNSFTWYPACYNFISQFKELIIFGDYENGRISLLDEMKLRFKGNVRYVREEDYKECKDANEILQKYGIEQIKKCIENAVSIPVEQTIDLADVEDVDIFKLEKLKTGISQLDRLLYGGLPFGGVVIISGKPGQGKSTLASQIMVNAIDQGFICFSYSGELPNYLFKAWTSFQVAGRRHVFEYSNKWGDINFGLSQENKAMISEWYRSRYFIYDNSSLDGNEKESLVATCEKMILKNGARVILLDNLMTAIDLESVDGSDKYEKQSQFIKRLSRLALKYNVLILLVAHKRKNNFTMDENDEVSGSGDITNLALITITYEKGKDIEAQQRLCKVSKNRLFGKINTKGWVLNFDEKSKRIYGNGDNLDYEYKWEKYAKENKKG